MLQVDYNCHSKEVLHENMLLVENCTSSLHFLHAGDEERLPIVFPINIAMVSPHCQPVNGTIDKISRKPSKYTCDKGYCICS